MFQTALDMEVVKCLLVKYCNFAEKINQYFLMVLFLLAQNNIAFWLYCQMVLSFWYRKTLPFFWMILQVSIQKAISVV
jgi:hypothetical protein